MRAGQLRHRIRVEQLGLTQDPNTGEMLTGWTLFASVWAAVEALSARDFIAASAAQSEVVARIKIRYRDDINPTMRIVHKGQVYNIHGLLPDAESGVDYITMPVSMGVNDG